MGGDLQTSITNALNEAPWLGLFAVFWGAAILSMSSCTIIRIPVVVGYVAGAAGTKRRAFLLTAFFVLGLVTSYTALGLLFGLAARAMNRTIVYTRFFYYVLGCFAVVAGAHLAGLTPFSRTSASCATPSREHWGRGLLGAYLFGAIFSIFEAPSCPCCGPVLFVLAGVVFVKGRILYALLVFLVYALGQSFPILLIGSFTSIAKYVSPKIHRFEPVVRLIAGDLLIAVGLFFILMA